MKRNFMRAIPKEWRALAKVFVALGDEHRQRILLTFDRGERLTVGQIAEVATLSRPAVSHHLKILRDVRFVVAERRGTYMYYHVNRACLGEFPNAARQILNT